MKEQRLKGIAEAEIGRQGIGEKVQTAEGTITIGEKK